MHHRISRFKDIIKHIRIRSVLLALFILIITIGMVNFVGRRYYDTEKKVLLLQGELNAKKAAMEYDKCLITRANIITMVGGTVDDMINSGTSNDNIEKYLVEQSDIVIKTLDSTSTGLYGWVKGEYLDGVGWVPDADYIPTERPWYTQTLESNQLITFVEPYLDMQTKTVMMTVSELMGDGESVIAMDVSLEPLQSIVKKVADSTKASQALVLDESGIVVAHSDETQLGKNYLQQSDDLGGVMAQRIINEGKMQFELESDQGNYSVYVDELQGGWFSVSLINYDVWKQPLQEVMIAYVIVMVLVISFLIFVFMRLNAKNLDLLNLVTRVVQEEKRGDEFKMLSETDRMTGLLDHVSGHRKIDELLNNNVKGAFLELDIDNFKAINDSYGHQTGDLVIIGVANALSSTFRSNDITIRLGGDEFGVYAVGIEDQQIVRTIISRLFKKINNIEIPELRGKKISISVGAVLGNGEKVSFNELYACADKAMYISKKTPGNSLTFATLDSCRTPSSQLQ